MGEEEITTTMPEVPTSIKMIEYDPHTIDPEILDEVIRLYGESYKDRWIGKERYLAETMPNTSAINVLMVDGQIAGAITLNRDRIITIGLNPKFQGRGLGPELFSHIAQKHPSVWISIGANAPEMLATVTHSSLKYKLVEDKPEIEELYRGINGVPADFTVDTERIEHDFLRKRFSKKGVKQSKFTAFTRSGSLHDASYRQFLFQNRA